MKRSTRAESKIGAYFSAAAVSVCFIFLQSRASFKKIQATRPGRQASGPRCSSCSSAQCWPAVERSPHGRQPPPSGEQCCHQSPPTAGMAKAWPSWISPSLTGICMRRQQRLHLGHLLRAAFSARQHPTGRLGRQTSTLSSKSFMSSLLSLLLLIRSAWFTAAPPFSNTWHSMEDGQGTPRPSLASLSSTLRRCHHQSADAIFVHHVGWPLHLFSLHQEEASQRPLGALPHLQRPPSSRPVTSPPQLRVQKSLKVSHIGAYGCLPRHRHGETSPA